MNPKIIAAGGFADTPATQKKQHNDYPSQRNGLQEIPDLENLKADLILAGHDLFLLPAPLMLPFLYELAFLINRLGLRSK